jgi:hypothetical protein
MKKMVLGIFLMLMFSVFVSAAISSSSKADLAVTALTVSQSISQSSNSNGRTFVTFTASIANIGRIGSDTFTVLSGFDGNYTNATNYSALPAGGKITYKFASYFAPGVHSVSVFARGARSDVNQNNNYMFKQFVVNGTRKVSETVKCVFNNTLTNQSCHSDYGRCSTSRDQYGRVINACKVNVTGAKNTRITWKSSCGGYAYTTIDGQNEYAVFNCAACRKPTCTGAYTAGSYDSNRCPIYKCPTTTTVPRRNFAGAAVGLPSNPSVNCTDSDGGLNYYVKGTVYGKARPSPSDRYGLIRKTRFNDTCSLAATDSNSLLLEGFCTKDGYVNTTNYRCPNGCKNGACVNATACKKPACSGAYATGRSDSNKCPIYKCPTTTTVPRKNMAGQSIFSTALGDKAQSTVSTALSVKYVTEEVVKQILNKAVVITKLAVARSDNALSEVVSCNSVCRGDGICVQAAVSNIKSNGQQVYRPVSCSASSADLATTTSATFYCTCA